MKIKTSHLILGAVAVLALSQGENVRQSVSSSNQIRAEQADFADRLRENRTEARQAEKLSKVALARFKNNCVLVVDTKTQTEALFKPGEPVIDPKQQNRTLRPGLFVCNRLGDTAVISEAGTITDIARIATTDLEEFRLILEKRK